jgi:hypothetical protein
MTITEAATNAAADREFTDHGLLGVTDGPGVFVLLRRGRVLMIDGTPNLEFELAAHQRGARGVRTVHATHFRTHEMALSRVADRCEELMEAYRKSHNSNVPPGNKA